MKTFYILFSVFVTGGANLPAYAAEERPVPSADVRKLICHGPHEERILEIISKGNGCILQYTKQKQVAEAAKAVNSLEPCKVALHKIRARLEAGNFACE